MPAAHLYIFSDACPTDWLIAGQENQWHTIVNFVVQTDPALFGAGFSDVSHEAALAVDTRYQELMAALASQLPGQSLKKWKTGPGYRARFAGALGSCPQERSPILNALSFREGDLRSSEQAVLAAYNSRIGGIEGRGIGFAEYTDHRGRRCLRHQFVNFYGLHSVEGPDNQLLVLLLMAWRIADQYAFYYREIVQSSRYGFDDLIVTVVSDRLSGDDEIKRKSEQLLQNLIDPKSERAPVRLTRSPQSDTFSGDLFVDNCAGLLNAAISDPATEAALAAHQASRLLNRGWHALVPHPTEITLRSALELIRTAA
jgi:hypothetical protein